MCFIHVYAFGLSSLVDSPSQLLIDIMYKAMEKIGYILSTMHVLKKTETTYRHPIK